MALKACRHCGAIVAAYAPLCPACGKGDRFPLERRAGSSAVMAPAKRGRWAKLKRGVLIACLVVGGLWMVLGLFGSSRSGGRLPSARSIMSF